MLLSPNRSTIVVLVAASFLGILAFAQGAETRTTVSFAQSSGGLSVDIRSSRARPLVVIVGGHRIAKRRAAHLRIRIPTSLLRRAGTRVGVRDGRTGALLGRHVLGFRQIAALRNPALTIVDAPPAKTTETSASVAWTADRASSVSCSIDGRQPSPCRSPLRLMGLTVDKHSVQIVAANRTGSVSASASWEVIAASSGGGGSGGSTAPTVSFVSTPTATTTSTTGTFEWTVSGATATSCSLDGAPAAPCSSPLGLSGLAVGSHALAVTPNGGVASTYTWEITGAAPTVSGVAAPISPSGYTVPTDAVRVTSSAALVSALAAGAPTIVLADGVYNQSSPFTNAAGSAIYAERLGGAVLQAGLVVGGNFGPGGGTVRGLVFDVAASSKTLGGGIVHIWGPGGRNSRVLDCVFKGNWAVPVGLLAYQPAGLRVERNQFFSFTDVGLRLSDNVTVPYGASTPSIGVVQDILVDGVSRPTPGASDGTAEAGLWLGHPVAEGVRRVKVRNVSWSGIETVNNAWNTTLTDLDIDMSGPRQSHGVGVYMEHYTRNVVFERFALRGVKVGFNGEWADPAWGGVAAAHNVTIRNGAIDSASSTLGGRQAGVYLDEGSNSTTVTGVTFRNQNWAAIGAYLPIGTNLFTGNSYALVGGAVPFSSSHI